MAINDDIVYRYSGSGTAVTSLGGAIHANSISTSVDQNLFQNIDSAEALAGSDKYACLYVINSGAVGYTDVGIYISQETLSPSTKIFISQGTSGLNGTEQSVGSNITEPAGIIWQRPLFSYQTVVLPDLAVNDYVAIWLKRTTDAAAAGSVSDYLRLSMVSA